MADAPRSFSLVGRLDISPYGFGAYFNNEPLEYVLAKELGVRPGDKGFGGTATITVTVHKDANGG